MCNSNKPVTFHDVTFSGSEDDDPLVFKGNRNSYIHVSSSDGTYRVGTFTWSAYYWPQTNAEGPLFGFDTGSHIGMKSNTLLQIKVFDDQDITFSLSEINTGMWNLLAIVLNLQEALIGMLINDNVEWHSLTITEAMKTYSSGQDIDIGSINRNRKYIYFVLMVFSSLQNVCSTLPELSKCPNLFMCFDYCIYDF